MSVADANLQERVLEELRWEPSIDAAHLGVAADDHVVTLTGSVPSYYQKIAAERAAERVFGVQALANDIQVVFPGAHKLNDTEIAAAVLDGLHRSVSVPKAGVDVTVSDGVITLRGGVEWRYQRQAAENAVRDLAGVVDVVNLIGVRPRPSRKLVKQGILSAFQRNAVLDARRIEVETGDGTITLRGTVHSTQERWAAERAAWGAPGVRDVENRLVVRA
jgi:osmotically-inducible protein OsmY